MILVNKHLRALIERAELKIVWSDEKSRSTLMCRFGCFRRLRLATALRRYKPNVPIDLSAADSTEFVQLKANDDFVIKPNELWLANTLETVMVPPHYAVLLTGRSSIARAWAADPLLSRVHPARFCRSYPAATH